VVAKPQVLPGAVAAGEYLNVLLGARYRRQWESESEHLPRTSRVQINAVAGVVAGYLKFSSEQTSDYRHLRDRVRGALHGRELTSTGLSQITQMDHHRRRYRRLRLSLHAGEERGCTQRNTTPGQLRP